MKRRWKWTIGLSITALACWGVYEAVKPGPPIPGDKRWCGAIREKPIDTWTMEEALGYAQNNCMKWEKSSYKAS